MHAACLVLPAICAGRSPHRNEEAKARFLAAVPAQRASTPQEIAATIAFLAGDKARFLTGQSIAIDGGLTAQ